MWPPHRALAAVRTLDEPNLEAGILNDLGNVHLELGEYATAVNSYRSALAPAERSGLTVGEATLHQNIGWALLEEGDPDGAEVHCHTALQLFESIDNAAGIARSLLGLGGARLQQGRLADAFELLTRSNQSARDSQARVIEAYAIAWTAKALLAAGELAAAQSNLDEALSMATETGERPLRPIIFEDMAHIAAAQGNSPLARELLARAIDALSTKQHPSASRLCAQLAQLQPRPTFVS